MLYDYLLKDVRIGKVEQGKRNAGDYYIVGTLKNAKFRHAHGTTETIWQADDKDLVDAIRSVFPKEGKDAAGNDWNGSNADIKPEEFDYNAAMQSLRNLHGTDYMLFPSSKMLSYKLDGLYCMTFATDLIGNGTAENPQFKKGSYIMEPSGNYVKVYDSVDIFVTMYDEAAGQYVEGWGPRERLRAKMRNMVPLNAVIAQHRELVDPRYLSEFVVPSVATPAPAPEAPKPEGAETPTEAR